MVSNKNKSKSTLVGKYNVGDKVEVVITKPNIGNFPIGIIPNGHVVCLFERTKKFFEIGSVWLVEITEVKPRNLVIKQIELVKDKTAVENEYDDKIAQLKENGLRNGNFKFNKLK